MSGRFPDLRAGRSAQAASQSIPFGAAARANADTFGRKDGLAPSCGALQPLLR